MSTLERWWGSRPVWRSRACGSVSGVSGSSGGFEAGSSMFCFAGQLCIFGE